MVPWRMRWDRAGWFGSEQDRAEQGREEYIRTVEAEESGRCWLGLARYLVRFRGEGRWVGGWLAHRKVQIGRAHV